MSWTDEISHVRENKKNEDNNNAIKLRNLSASLTPMVTKILEELGESLWGRSFWGGKKYSTSLGVLPDHNICYWHLQDNKYTTANNGDSGTVFGITTEIGTNFFRVELCSNDKHIRYNELTIDLSEEGLKKILTQIFH